VRTTVGWITGLVGLVLIFSISMPYMIRTQPSWNTPATPITFLVTAFLLGSLAVAAGLVWLYADLKKKDSKAAGKSVEILKEILQRIAIAALILLGIQFLVLPIYMAYLGTQGPAARASLDLMVGSFGFTLALRLLLVFVGAGVLAAYLFRDAAASGKERTFETVTYTAFALVLAGEVLGRFLFYATHVRIGF
jgi:anaerobic dimethyl sulfoxide reductase subunit C (anchor subunit)